MANEQRNREEKGKQDGQGQDQHRQPDKGGRQRDDDKSRREQSQQERGSGRQGRQS